MPSSFSANLLLELMADGENSGLWGDITNENLEILGRAISGVTTVSLAGTTHTLTVTQGALSEGHFAVLELGGSPTGTNTITISPNTVDRVYLVKNSSGQAAVFTQGSGGSVTVANGNSAIIFCNGAGSTAKVTELTEDFLRGANNLSDVSDAATALSNLGLTATAAEINVLDGFTGTADDLNHLDGVTSNVQTQLNGKISAVTAGGGLSGGGTSGTVTVSHADTSSASSVNNSGNTFIQDLTFDTYGHVTAVSSGTVSVNNATITVSTGGGLTGSGAFTTNQSFNETVTVSHADTSSQGNVNTSGTTVIDAVSVDTYGHVTSMATRDMASSIRSSIGATTFPSVGSYMLLRAVAGGPFLYNNTFSGGNLSAASASGAPYISGSNVVIIGGSWRCGGRSDAGTLTTAARANETTLWVRHA